MDETIRLAGLRDLRILDTAAEEPFDRLTRLAAEATRMPVACIALVDAARVWRKSMVGIDLIESARDGNFCEAAILGEHALLVADAAADPRFAATETVARHGARSYAGAPIRLASGAAVGTICVLDTVPRRDLGVRDAALLQGLAAAAGHLLDLRRELIERQVEQRELAAHARLLELAEEMAGVGTWRLDLATRDVRLSPAAHTIYGLSADARPSFASLLSAFELSDRLQIMTSLDAMGDDAAESGLVRDYRLRRFDDGSLRDVQVKARLERDGKGRPLAFVGVLQDVTTEKAAMALLTEQRLASDRQAQRMNHLAHTDTLTGLPNRRAFVEATERTLAEGGAASLALIDLDHFKSVNDRFGHDAGDRVLEAFGQLCAQFGASGFTIGRVGGEEFGLLVAGERAGAAAVVVAALRQMVGARSFTLPGGARLSLTFSAGLAEARAGDDWHSLFTRADAALYRAKHEGRDRLSLAPATAA